MGFGGFTAFLRRAEIYGYELLLVCWGETYHKFQLLMLNLMKRRCATNQIPNYNRLNQITEAIDRI